MLGQLITQRQKWKKDVELRNVSRPLKGVVWNHVIQILSDRFAKIAQATSSSELWKEAASSTMLTSGQAWPYLMWCPNRKLKIIERTPTTQDDQVIRFKSLKAMNENMDASQVCS